MKEPIRVLCVFSTLDRGGAESMCMNLYRHIDRDKVQFDFVKHTQNKGAFEDEIASLGGRIFVAPRFTLKTVLTYRRWWKRHLVEHPEHQIVHGHFFTISTVYFRAAKNMHRTTVGHIHASASDGLLKSIICTRISHYTDYPLACSRQAGRWIYGNRPFTVLNNGLDIELFRYAPEVRASMRSTLGLGNALILGTVANLSEVKNPMGLIDIFLAVKKRRLDARLVWVGDGTQRGAVEARLRQERIEDSVILLGVRDDVPDVLQAMDAFLLPSYSEGLPVSAIEAQAAGMPCFISDRVTRDVDITSLCQFLPIKGPENWAEDWADAILNDHTERRDVSEKIVAAGYDICTTAKWLEEFYLDIAKRGK